MEIQVQFRENEQRIDVSFAELHEVSDGGYESGYKDGVESAPDYLAQALSNTLEEYISDEPTLLREYAFRNCSSLKKIRLPKVKQAQNYVFMSCPNLEEIDCESLLSIGTSLCNGGAKLKHVNIPMVANVNAHSFQNCTSLENIELPSATLIGVSCFYGCTALKTVIITKEKVCTLGNINAFTNTPIASGTGFIYVPKSLVESYKVATNWSTYASQIKPISELGE